MPAGSWRDILNAMRTYPQWKISLDIEPASWEDLRRSDPQAYRELEQMLLDPAGRVEIVNGTFSQPFGWALSGESNIRQLQRGREVILEHFPRATIRVYAVQEPCWSSCLPQLLRSFGFTAAVLKNPGTAWGGYAAGFDAETVDWTGPDGTSIPAVPRYACEDLVRTWETESVTGSVAFARKAVAAGIPHPAGNCYQDLGWAARPKVRGPHIRYVTWGEYFGQVADKPAKQWRFSPEDILTTLPWGEKTLQTLAQQVRAAENLILQAEKLAAAAAALRGEEFPAERLRRAWDQLLWSQHHDSWITATTRSGRQAWAFQVAAQTMEVEEIANAIIGTAAANLSRGEPRPPATPIGAQWVRVFNTTAADRREVVEVNWASDIGTRRARVFDGAGNELPCQFLRPRKFTPPAPPTAPSGPPPGGRGAPLGLPVFAPGETLNAATVVFTAKAPAMGYETYRVEPVYDDSPVKAFPGASAATDADGSVVLETDVYKVRLDPKRGGIISSLIVKDGGREVVDTAAERLFNEYRGYFVTEKKWASSADSPANVTISERGPVRVRAQISGNILGRRFQTTITLAQGEHRIDFSARFTYDQDTWIGDPWDINPADRRTERRRSPHDGRFKLQAFFPAPLRNRSIYKNAAFDVCKSRNENTWFQGWHEIKHNIVLNWVDVVDEQQKTGLAVFSDHTTGYTHGPDHPLALVMGWGWEGGYWWGKCPLRGTQQVRYALLPHPGTWEQAHVSRENSFWNEPLVGQIVDGAPGSALGSQSLVAVSGGGVEIPTALVLRGDLLVRLFNAEGDAAERTVSLGVRASRVEVVELDGRVVRRLDIRRANDGRFEVKLALPRFAVRTLRCRL
jgi:alpha-mannosidase